MGRRVLVALTMWLVVTAALSALAVAADEEKEPVTVLGLVDARQLRQFSNYVEVEIRNWSYNPDQVEVKPGTVVVWLQSDTEPHNVRLYPSENNPLESSVAGPLLRRGQRWAVVFNEPGVYEYLCDPHDFMYGVVRVVQ